METTENKEIASFFVEWLRQQNMQGVEKILLGEMGKNKDSANTQSASEAQSDVVAKTQDPSSERQATSGTAAPPPAQPRKLAPPFEPGCGDALPVCKDKRGELKISETDVSVSTDGDEEVDVVNFEASLEQQLKQIVSDRSQEAETQPSAPDANGGKTIDAGQPGVDEWSGPDDLGYSRIPGRPGDEVYELVEDEEHRRHLLPYKEEPATDSAAATQQQTVAVTGKQSTAGDTTGSRQEAPAGVEGSVDGDNVPPAGSIEEAAPADSTDGPPAGTVDSNLAGEDGPDPQFVKAILGAMGTASGSDPATSVSNTEDAATATTAEKSSPQTRKPLGQPGPPATPSDQAQLTQDDSGKKAPPATVYEAFDLKVIYEVNRTGFEEHKDYPIRMHAIIAGRYQILEYLGSAAFSRAVQCVDLKNGQLVCVKIIRNNKDFFDQVNTPSPLLPCCTQFQVTQRARNSFFLHRRVWSLSDHPILGPNYYGGSSNLPHTVSTPPEPTSPYLISSKAARTRLPRRFCWLWTIPGTTRFRKGTRCNTCCFSALCHVDLAYAFCTLGVSLLYPTPQGLDEIKLLQYINSSGDADECSVLQLYDYFYHKVSPTDILLDDICIIIRLCIVQTLAQTFFVLPSAEHRFHTHITCGPPLSHQLHVAFVFAPAPAC